MNGLFYKVVGMTWNMKNIIRPWGLLRYIKLRMLRVSHLKKILVL